METTQDQDKLEALDFVYCGKRIGASGKLLIAIRPIRDGVLEPQALFIFNKKSERTVGCVYSGAQFSETSVHGIDSAQYVRRWEKNAELIDWQARDQEAASAIRVKKLETDAKKLNEIERVMLPLRRQYETYRKQHDHAGMEALAGAVVRALRSTPKVDELSAD